MINTGIAPELRHKLKDTLLKLDRTPKGLEILETLGIKRFIDAGDEDFAAVRALAARAGIMMED
jgi:ABC-type phosphate/phosphonate transport system substrate-binding protein